jgi:histidinol-phosphate aminotransferase
MHPQQSDGDDHAVATIEWLIANKPAGSIALGDEAYTHFAGVPVASPLVKAGRDLIVLRTFSKIFMMARPDILAKMMRYDGGMQSGALPLPSLACATASLTAAPLIAARRVEMRQARRIALDHLRARNIIVKPANANMIMIDWKARPAKDMQTAFRACSIEIERLRSIWPMVSRVTFGSTSENESVLYGAGRCRPGSRQSGSCPTLPRDSVLWLCSLNSMNGSIRTS